MKTSRLIDRLYPNAYRPSRWRRLNAWLRRWGRDRRVVLIVGTAGIMATIWFAIHVHYYNLLIALKTDAEKAWAQIEVQEQRRFHIQKNLARIVMDYAAHETRMHERLTKMRTGVAGETAGKPGAGSGARPGARERLLDGLSVDQVTPSQMRKLFPKIQVVAEQYARLRLTENFQQLSSALIDTETRIADAIMEYNAAVNRYTTALKQFPATIFAEFGGFSEMEFYEPSPEKLGFSTLPSAVPGAQN